MQTNRFSTLVILLLTFLSSSKISIAQNIQSISGQIVGSDGDFIMGNILLLNPENQSFIKGTDFDEEPFFIDKVNTTEVLVKFSSILFQDSTILIKYDGQPNIELGKINLQKAIEDLDEVVITGKLPRFNEKADGTLEINIAKTSLSSSNSLEEILSKTPGIIEGEDGFQIMGKASTIFYLNGKQIEVEQLQLIQPANINKIEVIRNPSARYDAAGAAVINITTLRSTTDGYHMKIQQNVTHSTWAGTNMKTTVTSNYAKNKFKLTGSYSFMTGDDREVLHTTRDRFDPEIFLKSDLTTEWFWDHQNISTGNLGIQYDLNKTEYLSLEYNGLYEQTGLLQQSNNTITDIESTNFYKSELDANWPLSNHSLSSNYFKSLDTLGSSLFVGGQLSQITHERNSDITEESMEQSIESSRTLQNKYDHLIHIYSGQIDYTKFINKRMSLEVGAKFSQIENDSKLDFLIIDEQTDYVLHPALSNKYNYVEKLAAGYINYRATPNDQFSYVLGLRTEFTNYEAEIFNQGLDTLQNNFVNYFPFASLNVKMSNEQSFSLTYSTSIQRPLFSQLNPTFYYQDPYTAIVGNPFLVPQKTHNLEAVLNKWGGSLKLGYNYIIDPLAGGAIRGDDEYSYVLTRLNWNYRHYFYTNISKQFTYKWWTSINSLNLGYESNVINDYEYVRRNPRVHPYFYTNNIFKVGKLFNLEILYWFWGDKYEGLFHREQMSSCNITIEKTFFDKALNCRFMINDVFNKFDPAGIYNIGQTEIFFERERPRNNFRLSISYNFGKLKKLGYKNKSTGKSEINRAN